MRECVYVHLLEQVHNCHQNFKRVPDLPVPSTVPPPKERKSHLDDAQETRSNLKQYVKTDLQSEQPGGTSPVEILGFVASFNFFSFLHSTTS